MSKGIPKKFQRLQEVLSITNTLVTRRNATLIWIWFIHYSISIVNTQYANVRIGYKKDHLYLPLLTLQEQKILYDRNNVSNTITTPRSKLSLGDEPNKPKSRDQKFSTLITEPLLGDKLVKSKKNKAQTR